MRIVMLSRVLPHHGIGGMQAVAWDLARAFVALGHSVTVMTAEVHGMPDKFTDCGVDVMALPGTSWRFYGPRWWKASRKTFQHLLGDQCDAVISVSAAGVGLLSLSSRYPNICFIMQAHGTSVGEIRSKWRSGRPKALLSSARNFWWLLKDLLSYPKFDAVVAVGTAVERELTARPVQWVLEAAKVRTISNGIDTALFRPDSRRRRMMRAELGCSEDCLVVVSASRLHRQKGTHLGLQAFGQLLQKHRDAMLVIVGDGPELGALERQADEFAIAEKVHFAGAVPRDDLPKYLQAADVMLFTTMRVEGLPLNVLEALACGIPAVVSQHLFADHELGKSPYVRPVDPGDAHAVSDEILSASALVAAGSSALPSNFTLETCASRYVELLSGGERPVCRDAHPC